MKVAIHNGGSWNSQWRDFCKTEKIDFTEVDCYSSNIIERLKELKITHLLWHFHHALPSDILMARNVLYAADCIGIKVFPNFNTCWHFDDKISQKYLLEAMEAPMVPSYSFFNKREALNWLKQRSDFPIVAKLRRGAGSYNVKLLKDYSEAKRYTSIMFGRGMTPTPGLFADAGNKLRVAGNFSGILKRLKKAPGFFKMAITGKRQFPKEKGYVYFQDFIRNNKTDLRVAVVNDHIWAFKRKVREGDFRASGSGMIVYDNLDISVSLIERLHLLTKRIGAQSLAYDLVENEKGEYLIVEISYGYSGEAIYNTSGYWNSDYNFVHEKVYPEHIILNEFLGRT